MTLHYPLATNLRLYLSVLQNVLFWQPEIVELDLCVYELMLIKPPKSF